MANIINQYGQVKLGVRYTSAPLVSTLWGNVFGVWNADITSTVTTLNTNAYSAYNGENTLNDVINSRNLTVGAGSVTYGTGKVGTNCFTLTAGQLNFPTNSMQFSGSFSYGMWIKYTGSVPQYNQIFTATGNASKYGYYLYKYGTEFYLRFGDGTTVNNDSKVVLMAPNNITVNTWFHIVVVFNAGSNAQIYKDGQLIGSVNHTMASVLYDTTRPNPIIGNNPGGGTDGPMTGQLDAITFWDKGLTYAEVAALYNEGNGLQHSFPSSVIAYVPSLNDATPNANHGTRPASTLTGGVPGPSFTTGKIGKAFSFDGVNDYIELPNNTFNSLTGDFSISLWFFLANSTSGFKTVVSAYINTGGLDYGWELDIVAGVQPYFAIYGTTTVTLQRTSTFTSGWNHFVVTRKGSTGTKMYHNGNLVINNTSTVNPRYNSTTYASIGALKYGTSSVAQYTPNGNLIDALSVWNKELTEADITELYNSGNGKQYPN